ncbi:MgtC/SapB family protein [Bacillus solimangrovi]|uniref:ATPase n=1 Tax=Bacillus solimangrovi TaxID=1305675 RepID=A0A1E5LGH8_9BACI|nr:MgtC/SapB family protein [Bacillus solimangrovi]OEH93156.1 ATPase [Bacillus solimangrovi]
MIFEFINQDFIIMSSRILISVVLCGAIGLEREIKQHAAGFRTHLLVGVGSCLMMLLSLYGFEPYLNDHDNIRFDPARIPSYVISGIGFLGAGTILVKGVSIRGLTTAASIWVVSGIGLIIGIGMYGPAILATILVLLNLVVLNWVERRLERKKGVKSIHLDIHEMNAPLETIVSIIERENIHIRDIRVKKHSGKRVTTEFIIKITNITTPQKVQLIEKLMEIEGVKEIS